MEDKGIRPYMLKWWFKVQYRSIAIFCILFNVFFGLYQFLLEGLVGDNGFTRRVFNECIKMTTNVTIVIGFFLILMGSVMYKSSMIEPLRYGSTRKETQIGYEICSVLYFVTFLFLYVANSILSSVIANNDVFLNHLLEMLILFLFFQGVLKLLYSIYAYKEGKKGVFLSIIMIVFSLMMIGIISVYVMHMFDNDVDSNNLVWIFPIICVTGITLWIVSIYKLKNKRETIALSDLEVRR